jgi:outer membrane protein
VAALVLLGLVPARLARGQERAPILVVSRKRLLNDTRHARALLEAEQRMTAELQARVDATKRALTEEEEELARLRATLPSDAFAARTTAFDRKVRRERREAQRQAAALQNAFRAERVKLLEAIEGILDEVRAERGAGLILDEDDALAADPALDITDAVIARFEASVPLPEIPDLEALLAGAADDGEAQ